MAAEWGLGESKQRRQYLALRTFRGDLAPLSSGRMDEEKCHRPSVTPEIMNTGPAPHWLQYSGKWVLHLTQATQ